jgi:molybdopterin/thiamine biosynthesis adenylyltransferase
MPIAMHNSTFSRDELLRYAQQMRLPELGLAAQAELLALNPEIQIHTYQERLTEHNAADLISQYDLIADGSDNFATHYLLHDVCFSVNKPYVYASVAQFQGYCSIFYGQHNPCLRCLFPVQPGHVDLYRMQFNDIRLTHNPDCILSHANDSTG